MGDEHLTIKYVVMCKNCTYNNDTYNYCSKHKTMYPHYELETTEFDYCSWGILDKTKTEAVK